MLYDVQNTLLFLFCCKNLVLKKKDKKSVKNSGNLQVSLFGRAVIVL